MLKCLAVFTFLLAIAQEPLPVYRDGQPRQTQDATGKPCPNAPPVAITEVDKDNAENAQRYAYYKAHPKEYWKAAIAPANASNWILACLGIIGAAVGIGTLCVVGRQVTNAMRSDRAWLVVEKAELVEGNPSQPGQVFVQCAVKNYGKTVARVLGMNARWGIGPLNNPGKTWDNSLFAFANSVRSKWTFLPGTTSAMHSPVQEFTSSAGSKVTVGFQSGDTQFIHGVVFYWDAFTKKRRTTRFCFREHHIDQFGKQKEGLHPISDPEYSQQT
jgi:hypothetical protein